MTSSGLTPALRRLAALALAASAASAACAYENPGFMFETGGATSSAGSTTTPTTGASASSVGPTDTGDPGSTTAGVTSDAPPDPTTADSSTTSTIDETTLGEGSSGTSTGAAECELIEHPVEAINDAFFVSGSTGGGTQCLYLDWLPGGKNGPCFMLNFGGLAALRLGKMDDGMEAMYAVRFDQDQLKAIVLEGAPIEHVRLVMTGWAPIDEDFDLVVGRINELWGTGEKEGDLAGPGESTFALRNSGLFDDEWSAANDGPRGASEFAAYMTVPAAAEDHFDIISDEITVDGDLVEQLSLRGLVVSYPPDAANYTYGPGLKSLESIPDYYPRLLVYTCAP